MNVVGGIEFEVEVNSIVVTVVDDGVPHVDERRGEAFGGFPLWIVDYACACGRGDCQCAKQGGRRELHVYASTRALAASKAIAKGFSAEKIALIRPGKTGDGAKLITDGAPPREAQAPRPPK